MGPTAAAAAARLTQAGEVFVALDRVRLNIVRRLLEVQVMTWLAGFVCLFEAI